MFTKHDTNETVISHCLITSKGLSPAPKSSDGDISGMRKKEISIIESGISCPLLVKNATVTITPSSTSEPILYWQQNVAKSLAKDKIPVNATWKTCIASRSDSQSKLCCRGCYVVKTSPAGNVTAVAINHENSSDSHVLFVDLLNEAGLSSPVDIHNTITQRYSHV